MKHLSYYLIALIFMGLGFSSCSNDDDQNPNQPSIKTQTAFKSDYPTATNVRWAKKRGYDVAYFDMSATRAAQQKEQHSAWYNVESKRAYAKYELSLEELRLEAPEVVKAWEASTFKLEGYELDDIDKKVYENGKEPTYKLEVEKGDVEYELEYTLMGELLSAKQDIDSEDDDEEDEPAPQEILDFFMVNLPDAQILDVDLENEDDLQKSYYEVEFSYVRGEKRNEYEAIFAHNYELNVILEEIDDDDYQNEEVLPAAVYNKAQELAKDGELDEISILYQSVNDFINGRVSSYCVEIEKTDEKGEEVEVYVLLASDGSVIR